MLVGACDPICDGYVPNWGLQGRKVEPLSATFAKKLADRLRQRERQEYSNDVRNAGYTPVADTAEVSLSPLFFTPVQRSPRLVDHASGPVHDTSIYP